MEVAVGVDRLDLVALAESEADLGLFAGMQFLALVALLGVERDPLNVVLRQLIGSPQQMTGTPVSLTLAMMLPQCLQM